MKLSIIVPVYNMVAGDKLEFCMKSLLSQTIEDYEIIAIDDKSTDESLTALKCYEKQHPDKVKVIASPNNRKRGGARNLGLRAATGEWIGFVDCNDWIAPEYYEKLLNRAQEADADIVGCYYSMKYSHDYEIGVPVPTELKELEGTMDEEKYAKAILTQGSMVAQIYKYSIFYDNGIWFPEYVYCEDKYIWVLAMLSCKRFAYVREPLYYVWDGDLTGQEGSLEKCTHGLKTMEIFLAECYKRGFMEEYPEEIEYLFTEGFYINTLFSYMNNVPFFRKRISYLKMLRDGIMAYYPEYDSNLYYKEKQSIEVKRLVLMHEKSPFRFFWYYMVYSIRRRKSKSSID